MLKTFAFDAAKLEDHRRVTAWNAFLSGLRAKSMGDASPAHFLASFSGFSTQWGFGIARLKISPQHISIDTKSWSGGLWLARIAEGSGTLRTERGSLTFSAGDVIVGKMPRELRLTAATTTCIEFVHFPAIHTGSRLATLPLPPVGLTLAGGHVSTAFLADLIGLGAARMDGISAEETRPLEITLVEFLMAAVATAGAAQNLIDGSKSKNAILLRATQAIELRLSDPELSPALVAEHVGISLRYLQKLFEDSGQNANHYIRRRRLERSYQDLADPLYTDLSIAEISYRWGFNDSAYFSRAFRDRYGISPSQHRENWRRDGMPSPVIEPRVCEGRGASLHAAR
jgi:AraC-like DNA-binding protein